MHKTRVAVLRGGPSDEYEVSLKTGESVLRALDPAHYTPVDVVITRGGEWLQRGMVRDPHTILGQVDTAFVALHGAYGEDGQVQRLLERHSVPYTGSGPFASAIAMNKALTKDRLRNTGIRMARHMVVGASARQNARGIAASISELFGPRYVVKPIAGGSSVGTLIVENTLALEQALQKTLANYEQVIVEEFIRGKEATCGVVEHFRGAEVYALPAIEIVPPQDASFFDYTAKYSGKSEELCPGRFSHDTKRELERLAALVHETLGLSQYSRSDFIVADDGIYFLEVNTLPGLTSQSLLPKSLAAVGCAYGDFVHHLLTHARTGRA